MKGKRFCILCLSLLCTVSLLAGCQGPGGKEVSGSDTDGQQTERPDFDWRVEEWESSLWAGENHTLYLGKYEGGLEAEQMGNGQHSRTYRTWGSKLYELDCFAQYTSNGGTQRIYSLAWYESETGEIGRQRISLPAMSEFGDFFYTVSSFDILSDQEIVLFIQGRGKEDDINRQYLAFHISMDGRRMEDADVVDLQTAIQENGGRLEEGYFLEDIYVDHRGYYYAIPDRSQGRVVVLGLDGKLEKVLEAETEGMWVNFACKTPDGDPLFRWYDPGSNFVQLAGYQPETGKKLYAEATLSQSGPMAMTEDGYLYYGSDDGNLYRWDLCLGSMEFCINYQKAGFGNNANTIRMVTDAEGTPVLLDYVSGEPQIYCMSTDMDETLSMIRLVSMTNNCEYISSCAIEFFREQEDYEIMVESPDVVEWDVKGMEAFRTRAMADLMAGKSADLYFVSAADMEIMYGLGVLADLTGVLPPELEKCIFPTSQMGGVIDGKQIGLTPEADVTVAMVSNDLWPKDSWTLEEALDLMDANPQLKYLLVDPTRAYDREQVLFDVFLQDPDHSPFLNLEEGTCNFDSPLFIRLLEYLKNYKEEERNKTQDGIISWIEPDFMEGTAAGFYYNLYYSYPGFTVLMAEFGDRYHPVGFPTDGEGGNYWNCDYYLVMNKDTPYREVLEKYLEELFEVDRQQHSGKAVRNDLMSKLMVYQDYNGEWEYSLGNGRYSPMAVKPDGSTWDQEYLELMNRCVYRSGNIEPVRNIISEEVSAFFAGSKDAEAVADVIQNKVQLYLDEHN